MLHGMGVATGRDIFVSGTLKKVYQKVIYTFLYTFLKSLKERLFQKLDLW